MISAIQTKMRQLFASPGIDISGADEIAAARATIAEASAEIRRRLADCKRLQRELEDAQEREERARAKLDLVEPANERARQAKDADAADRQRRIENGNFDTDLVLAEAVESAERAAREAQRNAEAIEAALPALMERVREAKEQIKENKFRIDGAVWKRRMAEMMIDLPEVRAAAAIVTDFAQRMEVLKDANYRFRLYDSPHGSIPDELLNVCEIRKTGADNLMQLIRAEVDYLQRMRKDPDTTLD